MTGLIDYSEIKSLSEIWEITANKFGDVTALIDPHSKPTITLTYSQLYYQIQQFAVGIQALGIGKSAQENIPSRVALFADNSPRWMIADQGIIMAGAANAVRSSAADKEELLYILEHSGSIGLVVENIKTLNKIAPEIYSNSQNILLEWIVLLSDESLRDSKNIQTDIQIINFAELIQLATNFELQPVESNPQKLATLIYTSGTTGKPKGVMLTHSNLIHQINTIPAIIQPSVGDKTLSILPTWHSFGRVGEYYT